MRLASNSLRCALLVALAIAFVIFDNFLTLICGPKKVGRRAILGPFPHFVVGGLGAVWYCAAVQLHIWLRFVQQYQSLVISSLM